ncbi:type I DNA topoisomerase [Phocaeicola paurosaccharolyticus]|jgi:DNA topoisomerase I|uniref:type I DNA topoisomerase n=1 Tax=Phocaeicola paurosaccharolyticus TaxID=732242 RepID=UPI002FE1B5FB
MHKNLVIVESPAKAKTIEKFLGADYKVLSSYGHIRDLKKKEFSIDVENGFEPTYEIPDDKKALVKELKSAAKNADMVWLASDEDREGEAISWHLFDVLKLDPKKTKRIVFHEITKSAILKAIENPRDIDFNLVNAQQARRVLDRIVGFELSPVLWRKVKPALSAGRVQSVAVRLIVEREREANAFVCESSYRVVAIFEVKDKDGSISDVKAELSSRLKTKEEAEAFLQKCVDSTFRIEDITTRPLKKSPAPPFTTSTLQQEAARKLGLPVARTMMIAQKLYENGLITYMRTDSVNLSSLALNTSRDEIISLMGEKYVKNRHYSTKSKGAQEAHEAIRPTYMSNVDIEGTPQEKKLYELIWKRTIASQMADAELEKTTANISISNDDRKFVATGEVIKFDGFLKVYAESYDDDNQEDDSSKLLPPLVKGDEVKRKSIVATERFTQAPPRYTEGSLVRKLEELGIGRPSTYAPTISTVQQRGYVEKSNREGVKREYDILTLKGSKISAATKSEITGSEKSKLLPTDVGIVVNDFLMEFFPGIMDYNFTAKVEKEFDEVADGEKAWNGLMGDFYKEFHPLVNETMNKKSEHKVGERLLGNDPKSGKPVFVKIGRFGPVIQIGTADDEEKPKFAQITKGCSMESISLEEALEAFKLPRDLGEYDGKIVTVGEGRFGPYIRYDNSFTSIPKDISPMEINLDEAVELINAKKEAEAKKMIKSFDEEPELQILNGRFGPYISYKKKNFKIPSSQKPEALTLEECMTIVNTPKEKSTAKKVRKTTKKKE